MEPQQFIEKWRNTNFGERQGAQSFFNDLCALVGHKTPADFGNPDAFTFERWVPGGFADAYFEEHFGWEFKALDSQLDDAMNQLLRYQVHLKTPPLLIVSSFRTIRIRTNFPGMETVLHEIRVSDLDQRENLDKLRRAFHAPADFRPGLAVEKATRETADLFHKIVTEMERLDANPEKLARYLNQIVFCLYAEGASLLDEQLFTHTVARHLRNPARFDQAVRDLFNQMSGGGLFGYFNVPWFNGNLFAATETLELSEAALQRLAEATSKNWRSIEPSIFGTLFERALDASKRSQLGAHYTSAADIELVVEPVVMEPLRREWETARREVDDLISEEHQDGARVRLEEFQQRLFEVTVLDPACGSGNFLYIALRSLLDLEKEVIDFAATRGWRDLTPRVRPDQMHGLEINPYAAELARTALWIGYIQWHQANGFPYTEQPFLTPLNTIQQTDAILDLSDPDNPTEPEWPAAEFIISNPPFLGGGLLRQNLGDEYVEPLFGLFGTRIPNSSDICCYWFEKARAMLASGQSTRCGLLATQGIRGRANRSVLERIKETGDIFAAHSDRPWVLDGAAVHVSIVCFDNGSQLDRALDGQSVPDINSNLMSGVDLTKARTLSENIGISFIGDTKKGKFEITAESAFRMLNEAGNPNGKPNSDVVRPWANGLDITRRWRNMWIVDFDMEMPENEAALYEKPFEHIKVEVKPARDKVRNPLERQRWWVHGRPAPDWRNAVAGLGRYIATARVAKHRLFVFLNENVLPDGNLVVFARNDYYAFGVLHSRVHEVWARATGTQLREAESGFRYSHTMTFETFPFPEPDNVQREAIGSAAARLNELREGWLNPLDAPEAKLKKRTLTNLYNQRPTWLANAHAALDATVAAAYGWPADLTDAAILERLLALNLERSG